MKDFQRDQVFDAGLEQEREKLAREFAKMISDAHQQAHSPESVKSLCEEEELV